MGWISNYVYYIYYRSYGLTFLFERKFFFIALDMDNGQLN